MNGGICMDLWCADKAKRVMTNTRKTWTDQAVLLLHSGKNAVASGQILLRDITDFRILSITFDQFTNEDIIAEDGVSAYHPGVYHLQGRKSHIRIHCPPVVARMFPPTLPRGYGSALKYPKRRKAVCVGSGYVFIPAQAIMPVPVPLLSILSVSRTVERRRFLWNILLGDGSIGTPYFPKYSAKWWDLMASYAEIADRNEK